MLTDGGALSTAPTAAPFERGLRLRRTKTKRGSAIDRAGLTNGNLFA